jgi:hypothetical protein
MGLQNEAKGPPLAVEGRQELGSAVRGHQQRLDETLRRGLFGGLGALGHAGFEIPSRAVRVTQTGATGAASILRAHRAQGDITQ